MTQKITQLQTSQANQIPQTITNQTSLDNKDEVQSLILNETETVTKTSNTQADLNLSQELFSEQNNNLKVNAKIEDSKQGTFADCWILSALNALTADENSEGFNLIKNATCKTNNGYSIYLKGLDETYEVTNEELNNAKNDIRYAKGDIDVVLWELVFKKALDKHKELQSSFAKESGNSVDFGSFSKFMYMLTGEKVKCKVNGMNFNTSNKIISTIKSVISNLISKTRGGNYNEVFDKIQDKNTDCVATISFGKSALNNNARIIDIRGNSHNAAYEQNHAWSIEKVHGINVTIVNPFDSSNKITVTRDELMKKALRIEYFEF